MLRAVGWAAVTLFLAGTKNPRTAPPVEVEGISDAAQVVAGWSYSCARRKAGQVLCWGSNNRGQIGIPDLTEYANPPTAVPGVTGAVDLVAGLSHTCALDGAGRVTCWGWNRDRILGGLKQDPPVLTDLAQIAAGAGHVCGLHTSGEVSCFGANVQGQLGVAGAMGWRNEPVVVAGLPAPPYRQVVAHRVHRYIVLYRDELLRSVASGAVKRRIEAVNVAGTYSGDDRALTLLASRWALTVMIPRLLEENGKGHLLPLPDPTAGQVPDRERLRELKRQAEQAGVESMQTGSVDQLLAAATLASALTVISRTTLLVRDASDGHKGDSEIVRHVAGLAASLIAVDGTRGADAAIKLLTDMVEVTRITGR